MNKTSERFQSVRSLGFVTVAVGTGLAMLVETLTIFCGLGAATLSAVPARRWPFAAVAFTGAFALVGLWTGFDSLVGGGVLGSLVGLVVACELTGRRFVPLAAACSGVLAAVGVSVLRVQGMGLVPALILCIGIPGASMFLASTRPAFAPLPTLDGALLLVLALAVIVASLPAVESGWQFAAVTNLSYSPTVGPESGSWMFLSGGLAMAVGGGHALWWRRR